MTSFFLEIQNLMFIHTFHQQFLPFGRANLTASEFFMEVLFHIVWVKLKVKSLSDMSGATLRI